MRNILRLRVLGILLLALGLFGGTVASVGAQDDGAATPPADSGVGSVTVAAFWSEQVAVPTLTEGAASAFGDSGIGAGFVEATFSIYINGDTASTPFATVTTTNGDAKVVDGVPVGTHLLTFDGAEGWDSPYSYSWEITVFEGAGTFLTVLIPWGEAPGFSDTGSLVLSSFAADQLDSPEFLRSAPINVLPQSPEEFPASADDEYDIPYTGAYTVDREFLVYLNEDTASVPTSIQTIGGTTLLDGLPEGTHTLVDAQSGYSISFDIAQGSVTTVVAVFPEGFGDSGNSDGDRDTEAPGQGDDDADGDDGDDDGSDDGDDDGGSTGGDVTKLPSTGQGSSSDSSSIVLLLGAMSLVALAGGFAWRQRRSA
jgi:MYXO-CTERM domain-containing protein